MKVTNKIFIIALMLSLIFSVSAVVAQEDMTFNQSDIQSVDMETDLGIDSEETPEISDEDSLLGEVEKQKLGEGNEKTVEGDNFTSIQTTINSASSGDTIFLGGKTYNGSSTITVNKDGLTIIGGSSPDDDAVATLDGEGLIQIMKITASNVVIKGIKFVNAKFNGNGGAVQWSGENGVLKNSKFINNNAERYGGAIYWSGKNASVEGCQFEKNVATGQSSATGGAIFFDGINTTLKNSNFINNTANYAGAVHIAHANSKLVDCLFENNSAIFKDSGALRCFGSDCEIINSRFINNSAVGVAGAIYMHTVSDMNVTGCTFINNTAGGHGGAIYSNAANTSVSNSKFIDNSGDFGGAIYVNKDSLSVIDSNFTDNSAGRYGGAIILESNAINSKVYNSKFENNIAETYSGGAIFWKSANGVVKDCEFNNNFALISGGAIRIENSAFNLSNSNFTYNHVMNNDGGAIYWLGSDGIVNDCKFVNNSANNYAGGAIYVNANSANHKISNSQFSKNFAKTYGGALVSYNADASITYCNFTDNTGANGGAIHFDGNSKYIANCKFINNTATTNGGAIRAGGINVDNVTLTYCIFENNKALGTGAGGAVLWYAFNSRITESKFINNSAYSGGAINLETNAQNYYKESRNTTLSNCTFEDNHAGSAGGAIRWLGVEGKINNCNFTNNSAGSVIGTSSNGGAIFFHSFSRDTILSNSNFINNSCEGSGGTIHWAGVNGTLTNCNISGTSSYNGGAVYWNGADGKLMDSSISNANATNNGGAIYWNGAGGKLMRSSISNANATNTGGAIYWNAVNADVSYCEFERNYAKNYAGAIIFSSNALNAKVSNSNITRNGAGISTGGIRCEGANASVSNCSFTNNYAVTGGSAAFYVYASDCKLSDSSFINNTAFNDAGAVLWNSRGFNGTLTNCEFINNTAGRYGGGLYWYCPDGVLKNATFVNNSAGDGGGLYWSGANAQISDCHFTNNSANLTAGAALVRGDNGNLSNCEFTDNSAGTLTGGLYWYSSYGTVSNCNFTGNSAGTNNGAMGINSGATNVTVTGSKFENNRAGDLGGAFHWNGPNGKLDDCTFINNTAVDGGASYWNGANGALNNCEFVNNSASSSGAIHWRGNNGNINGSTFTSNTAELGGAVHTTADGVTISENNFINNTGLYAGSALWIDGDNNKIRNNDIVNDNPAMTPTYITDSKNTVFEGNTGDIAYHNAKIIMEVADVFVGYVGRTLTIPIYIHDDLGTPLSGEVTIQNYGAQQLVNGRANFTIEMPESEQLIGLLVYYEKINRNIEVDVVDPSDAIDDIVQPERMGKDEIIIELPVNAKGNVTVTVNNKEYVAPVINGTAVIEFNDLKNGVYPATVFYSGDGVYDNMTKEFNLTIKYSQIDPQTSLFGNKDVSVIYSGTGIYSVLVFKYGKLVGAGESVTFNFNGKNTVVKTDANSYATFKFSADAKVGKHTIKATYFGTTVTNKVTIGQIIKASDKKVKKSKKVTKIKITLNKVDGKYLSKKVLKIKFNKKTYKVKTNKKGVAVWKVKKSMLKKLKVGKKVKYTVTYGKATLTKKLTIKK